MSLLAIVVALCLAACDELFPSEDPDGETGGPADTQPSFGGQTLPSQNYTVEGKIAPLVLPEATGGNPPLRYSLTPEVPGLSFDPAARTLAGTPSAAGAYAMTYTVEDEDADSDVLTFTITVKAAPPEPPEPEPTACLQQLPQPTGSAFRDCDTCPNVVEVPTGSFMMGAPREERGSANSERPVHQVTISEPFAVGIYEVTSGEWDACVADEGCELHLSRREKLLDRCLHPVTVSWHETQKYVEWLSQKTGAHYRLLSEAEWEYVARAGTTTPYHTGETITGSQANSFSVGSTVPVGSYAPNAFGLYDVHGNVNEFVQDCWNRNYEGAPIDGSAWESGICHWRVARGGAFSSSPQNLRSASRRYESQGSESQYIGFRVARTLD